MKENLGILHSEVDRL